MITVDLHTHTLYSRGRDLPGDMFTAARKRGIELYGFSEHSPRPLGYDYPHEYREHLAAHMSTYEREVRELQEQYPGNVLFGMEMDWFNDEPDFIKKTVSACDYDYLIGSTHFLGKWGFDASADDWAVLSDADCTGFYEQYFQSEIRMAQSGLFNIAAHPDLIKIFSVERFHNWLNEPPHAAENRDLVRQMLVAIKGNGMAMEISSAGIRKPCREIYPCAAIMRMAAELKLPISFASDAHSTADAAFAFPQLASYAKAFGYTRSAWFCKGTRHWREF